MKRKIARPTRPAGRSVRTVHAAKADPNVITEAMYKQDVAPFQEGFEVLAEEMAKALPQWSDAVALQSPAKRAGLLLRTMRNAAGFSQTKLGEKARMNQTDISALENGDGKQGPTFDVLARVADACGFYITFSIKTVARPKAIRGTAKQHVEPLETRRVLRTFVMGDNGELNEFEGTSPALKKDDTIIVEDLAGNTLKVSVGAARAKVAIQEAEEEIAAAVQLQSAVGFG